MAGGVVDACGRRKPIFPTKPHRFTTVEGCFRSDDPRQRRRRRCRRSNSWRWSRRTPTWCRDSGDDEAVEQSLADRLLALDLPDRARPVLEKLMKSGEFAGRESPVRRQPGDAGSAGKGRRGRYRRAGRIRKAADLPPELAEQALILRAESKSAVRAMRPAPRRCLRLSGPPAAMEARAQILETASDWPGAEQAWSDCAAADAAGQRHAGRGPDPHVLRLATATARADDTAQVEFAAGDLRPADRRRPAGRHVPPADGRTDQHDRRHRALPARNEPWRHRCRPT